MTLPIIPQANPPLCFRCFYLNLSIDRLFFIEEISTDLEPARRLDHRF